MISKIIHILLSLPSPSEELFKNIEEVFTKILWNDKPPKFKLFTLEQQTANGGLQFPDIRKIDKTMKASWIKRMYKSDEGWASVPVFYGLNGIYEYGEVYLQKKSEIRNVFWKDVITSVVEVYNNSSIKSIEHLLSMPIWYNTKVIQKRIPKWTEKGICTIGDLLDENGKFLTFEYINNRLQLKCDFLLYNRLKRKIVDVIGNNLISQKDNIHPRMPFILYIIEPGQKGNKNAYFSKQASDLYVLTELQGHRN